MVMKKRQRRLFGTMGIAATVFLWPTPSISEPSGESSPPAQPQGVADGPSNAALEQLNTGAWVNEFTGQPAFAIPVASISNHGGISYGITLQYYGGGLEHRSQSKPEFNSTSWVGEGFSFAAPSVSVNHKGTASLLDDEYFLALDGQSMGQLVPEATANSDFFYPKNAPYLKVQRVRASVSMVLVDPFIGSGLSHLPPTSVPPVTAEHAIGWTVTMPSGVKYNFGSGAAGCDEANVYSYCMPTTGDKVGYEPFYNFSSGATSSRIPVQWFLREIRSTDDRFSIFFEYDKVSPTVSGIVYQNGATSPSTKVDQAIYLKKVYSVNGNTTADSKIAALVLNRENRIPADYFDNSAVDPLARFEKERILSVSTHLRDNSTPERMIQFHYSNSATYSRTRLTDLKEHKGNLLRRLYTFTYDDPGSPWRIKKIKAPNSADWTYTYEPTAGSFSLDPQILNLTALSFNGTAVNPIADFVKPQVFLHQELGNKLYLGLEDGSTCTSPSGNQWKRRLVELENFGTHWAVQRVFMSAHANCPDKNPITIAPDGSYMAWSSDGNVRIYALAPRIGAAGAIDLASPPSGMQLLSANLHQTTGAAVKAALFAYENWMAAYDQVQKRAITFFHKNISGQWERNNSTGCAEILPLTVTNSFEEGFIASNECVRWGTGNGEIEVRGGNDFIAVKFNETFTSSTSDDGASIRLYTYRNGAVSEFKYGLHKSRRQKLGASSTRIPMVDNDGTMLDRDFFWDPDFDDGPATEGISILDISVRGNLVGLVLGWRDSPNFGKPRYLYVFNFDGRQLRFLYQRALAVTPTSYQGAHIFLGENYFLYRNESSTTFDYHYFNPMTWEVTAPVTLAGSTSTSLKVLDGYFHMENIIDRSKSFQPAVVSSTLDIYMGTSTTGKLYAVDPTSVAPAQVNNLNPNPAPQANFLFNVFQQGDKFLGISKNSAGTNTWTYVYVHMQASGNQVQWLPVPAGVSGMSATLISTGVMAMEQVVTSATDYKFSGVLRFHGDYKGALLGAASPLPRVVTRVDILTKSAQSQIADGSLRRLDISYPSLPRFNHAAKTPNMNRVVVNDVAGMRKNTTDYFVDYVPRDPTLPPNSIFQGLVTSGTLSNASTTGTGLRPGDGRVQSCYRINTITTGLDGTTALREAIQVPFPTKSTEDKYYFDASMATETRYALPNSKTGQPQITIVKNGGDFHVSVLRLDHEFSASPIRSLPRQTAAYLFKSDPCTAPASDDPCSNLTDFTWLDPSMIGAAPEALANSKRATSSRVMTYDGAGNPQSSWIWKPKELGVSGLSTLDGTTPSGTDYSTQGKWIKERESLRRASDETATLAKHGGPTLVETRGIQTTTFYSGREGRVLASVQNSSKAVCTFLDGEEEIVGAGRGAFGDWEAQGEVSAEAAHTGTRSIKVTQGFGPSVNVAYRRDSNFWARKKGIIVSGWVYIPGSAAVNPNPRAAIELRPNATTPGSTPIDLWEEYLASHGNAFPYNRWFKLERLVSWEDLNAVPFTDGDPTSNPLLRIWFGKSDPASNSLPVYVDDLRVHPADAVMSSQTNDEFGRVTANSDAGNNPSFLVYDTWGEAMGVKDGKGRVFSSSAYQRIED